MNRNDTAFANRSLTKQTALAYLGEECTVCGVTTDLEFDHIDRSTKLFTIGAKLDSGFNFLKPELDKCQLLCSEHHKEKTRSEASLWTRAFDLNTHGSVSMYVNHGCRCSDCREAWRIYMHERKSAKLIMHLLKYQPIRGE